MNSSVQIDLNSEVQQASVAVRENRLEEAMTRLQNVLAQEPDHFAANHLLGVTFLKAGRLPEAIARLLKVTLSKPDHAGAHAHLGMAYAAANKVEKARGAYEAALKINPDYELAQKGLAKLPLAAAPPKKSKVTSVADVAASDNTANDAVSNAPQMAPPILPASPQIGGVKSKVKDFTTSDGSAAINKAKGKSKSTSGFLSGVDWADVTLLGLGAVFLVLGLWLRFGAYVDGIRPYKTFGIIGIVIGISMLKAGMPGREHWRDDL